MIFIVQDWNGQASKEKKRNMIIKKKIVLQRVNNVENLFLIVFKREVWNQKKRMGDLGF